MPSSKDVKLYSKKTTSILETILNNKRQNQKNAQNLEIGYCLS